MSVSDEIVRQEVSGLYRFIEPLVRRCAELREDYPVYGGTSLEFFGYFVSVLISPLDLTEG